MFGYNQSSSDMKEESATRIETLQNFVRVSIAQKSDPTIPLRSVVELYIEKKKDGHMQRGLT